MKSRLLFTDMEARVLSTMAMYLVRDNLDDIDKRISDSLPQNPGYSMIRNLGIVKIDMRRNSGGKVNLAFAYNRDSQVWNAIDCSYKPVIGKDKGENPVNIAVVRGSESVYMESLQAYHLEDKDVLRITGPGLGKEGYDIIYDEFVDDSRQNNRPSNKLGQRFPFGSLFGSHSSKRLELFSR